MNTPDREPEDVTMTDASVAIRRSDFTFLQDFDHVIDLILNGGEQDLINRSVTNLKARIEQSRKILEELPGLQFLEEEQEVILERETTALKFTRQHLEECLQLEPFVLKQQESLL